MLSIDNIIELITEIKNNEYYCKHDYCDLQTECDECAFNYVMERLEQLKEQNNGMPKD